MDKEVKETLNDGIMLFTAGTVKMQSRMWWRTQIAGFNGWSNL
jgi:hypothetical protein